MRRLVGGAARAMAAAMVVVMLGGCAASGPGTATTATTGSDAKTASEAQAKEPYRIGEIQSLTGPYAAMGVASKEAVDLEVARINAAGGINGHPIEIVLEDDGTDPAKAAAAATKLIEQDKVLAIVGPCGTPAALAIKPEVERAGVPLVCEAAGNAIGKTVNSEIFSLAWPNFKTVPFLLQYMQKQGVKKIGVISDSNAYGKDGLAVLLPEVQKFGMTVVANETYNTGDKDMTAQLTKIKGAAPDAVILWAAGSEGTTVVKNAEQLGLKATFYGGSGLARMEFVKGAGTAAEGYTFVTGKFLMTDAFGDAPSRKVAEDFAKRFQDKYGKPANIFASTAADAFLIVADSLGRMSGEVTPKALRDEIEKTSGFVGVDGTLGFSATDHWGLGDDSLQIYKVEGGKWVMAK